MSKVNPDATIKINDYIDNAPDHYRALLKQIRSIILKSDIRLVEDWKWRAPNFAYEGMVCWMAHFKGHVGINFFKGALINDSYNLFDQTNADAKGNRIIKIKDESDLNEAALIDYVKQGVEINANNLKPELAKKVFAAPDDFIAAIKENDEAWLVYENFSQSKKNDYLEWILDAKREATRLKRIQQSVEWISEGKDRNWKYH